MEQSLSQMYGLHMFLAPIHSKFCNTKVQIQQYIQTWMTTLHRCVYLTTYIEVLVLLSVISF